MDIILPLLLQVILIAVNAFFACAEISIISTNEAKLNKLVLEGNSSAKVLQKLTANPSKFLSTIQVAITLAGFLSSAFAAENFAGKIVSWLINSGIATQTNQNIFHAISVVVVTLILSYFTLVFGELLPKRIGMRKAEKIALVLARPLSFISKMFTPIVWFLTVSINGILRLVGIDPNQSDGDEGEENIIMLADMSSQKGLIDKEEHLMIRNVFEFDDLPVRDFATHRTEVEFLWSEDNVETWDNIIKTSFHKFYPICKDTADDIIGVLNIREYFKLNTKNKKEIMEKCVKPAYFVPEMLKADVLFKKLKDTRNHFAIVLDEYGGVEGIVTMDDILEQIVGDFNNDIEYVKPEIKQIKDKVWRVSGDVSINEINNCFGTQFSQDEYDTFSGLVFNNYGNIPADNTEFEISIEKLNITVTKIIDHKIKNAIIRISA
jgi:putative hemolysin